MQGLFIVADQTNVTLRSDIVGIGGLVSGLGGLWGYVMTADSLVPLIALAIGAASGIVYLWNKPKDMDVKRQLDFKDRMIADREKAIESLESKLAKVVVESDQRAEQLMRQLYVWKAAAIAGGVKIEDATVKAVVDGNGNAAQ